MSNIILRRINNFIINKINMLLKYVQKTYYLLTSFCLQNMYSFINSVGVDDSPWILSRT